MNEQLPRPPAAPQSSAAGRDAELAAAADALAGVDARTVVLVEGVSDRVAVQAMAARRGRDLAGEGVGVVPMGGARSIGRYLRLFGPGGLDLTLAGLCDAGEEGDVRRGLERAGLGANLDRAEMASLGFYVCVLDLEDELIRCLGAAAVEQVVASQGELGPFRTFQRQPAQRERGLHQQLHRFMGTGSGRKTRYAQLLVDALDLADVP
ncbi:MAG: TOPRIM nucleotidyl transferase/hydrolase domain-containing protein, partial [Actinomycetota bacterium]